MKINEFNPLKLTPTERAERSARHCAELLAENRALRQAAHADQIIIQRLRVDVDCWFGVAETALTARSGDEFAAENHRLAALTGKLATEAEALRRERDALQVKLTQAQR